MTLPEIPEPAYMKLEARFNAFKTALQKADPKAPAEKCFFRKTKVADPLRYIGIVGHYLSDTVGTNLLPTSRPDYYDLRDYAIKGEPGWAGTPATAWRDQEFARLLRRYIAYKMS